MILKDYSTKGKVYQTSNSLRNHSLASPSYYVNGPEVVDVINTIILGKMYDYGIPKEKFEDIKNSIVKILADHIFNGSVSLSYHEMALVECDNIMPTYNFKSQLAETLE